MELLSWREIGFCQTLYIYWECHVISVLESLFVVDYIYWLACVESSLPLWVEWNQSDHVNSAFYLFFFFLYSPLQVFYWDFLRLSLTGRLFLLLLCLCVVWCKGCQVQKNLGKELSVVPISKLKHMLAPRLVQNLWLCSALFTLPLF